MIDELSDHLCLVVLFLVTKIYKEVHMKNKLLITTALVAVSFASNVYAVDLIVSTGDVRNPDTGVEDKLALENDGVRTYHYDSIKVTGGKLTIDNFKIRSDNDVTISGGEVIVNGTNPEQHGGIRAHDGTLNITGGTITATATEIHGGITNVSENAVINVNDYTEFGGDSELNISGGTLNLFKGIVVTSPVDFEPQGNALLKMTGGVVNMENSYFGSSLDNEEDEAESRVSGTSQLLGGTINVNKERNIFLMDNAEVSNTINIAEGASLEVWNGYKDADSIDNITSLGQGTLNLNKGAVINLSGTLASDIESDDGTVNFNTSTAQIKGDADISTLVFNATHKMSEAISGKYGADDLLVNKGILTYDKAPSLFDNSEENTFLSIHVADGATLDILNNTLVVNGDKEDGEGVIFEDNSTLKFAVTSAEDYGQIKTNYVNISEKGTTLDMTFNGAALAEGESMEIKLFDQSEDMKGVEIEGKFDNLKSNSRYDFADKGNGVYTVTGVHSASDIVEDAGGSVNNVATAEAWDNVDTSKVSNQTTVAVAQKLAALSNNTTKAGQKAYLEALTAVAPDVAPAVQQTSSETANQVFNAVGTRLSGGSVASSSQGMSSGDNPFERVVAWVQGLFNKSKLDDTSKAKGFDSDTYGTAFGIEKMLDNHRKVGVGYAYSKTDIDGFMRDTDVKTHTALLYGEYKPSNWYVNGIATYGWSDYEEKKNVAGVGVKADYDVETFGLQAMTGYEINLNDVQLTPEAGLRYVHISQDSYKDSAEQKVSGNDSYILTGVIGAKVSKNFELDNGMTVKPEARLAATYDLKNDSVNSVVTLANGSAYQVNGKALDRFGMEFGAGVTAEVNDNVEFSFGYEGKFRQDYQDHTGLFNVKYKF